MATSSRPNQDADHGEVPGRRCPRKMVPIVLVLIGFHMLAVLAEPLHFFSRSEVQTSPEFGALRRTLAPYVEWLYLDHGYFFFAPNPGPSHLVAAKLIRTGPIPAGPVSTGASVTPSPDSEERNRARNLDRTVASESQFPNGEIDYLFPDRTRQWPRLLYHRYFMLSEFYNNVFAPSELLEEDRQDPVFVARWAQDREFYSALQNSIANSISFRLSRSNPTLGQPQRPSVDLMRLERPLPSVEQILKQGIRLNDSRALEVLPESPGLDVQAPRPNSATMGMPFGVSSATSGVSSPNKILRAPSEEAVQPQRLKLPPLPLGKP
ncbi:MAG: hypothetical protein ACK52S_04230 [Pirellula sp.]|jgi:hypothetical protein